MLKVNMDLNLNNPNQFEFYLELIITPYDEFLFIGFSHH